MSEAQQVLAARIDEYISMYGSLREVGASIGIDAGYLQRLRSGEKVNPSDATLARLGLRRVVTYERIKKYYAATPLQPRTKSA